MINRLFSYSISQLNFSSVKSTRISQVIHLHKRNAHLGLPFGAFTPDPNEWPCIKLPPEVIKLSCLLIFRIYRPRRKNHDQNFIAFGLYFYIESRSRRLVWITSEASRAYLTFPRGRTVFLDNKVHIWLHDFSTIFVDFEAFILGLGRAIRIMV